MYPMPHECGFRSPGEQNVPPLVGAAGDSTDTNHHPTRHRPRAARRPGDQGVIPHGIMFHHFHDGHHPAGQGSLSADDLRALLRFVGRGRILGAREWLERAVAGRLEPGQVCLTFDDNLRCQYDVALPVLAEAGLTAFWFVPTATLDGGVERLELYWQFRVRCFDDIDLFYEAFFRTLATSVYAERVERALRDFDAGSYLAQFRFYSEPDRRFRFVRDEVLGPRCYQHVMDTLIQSMGIELRELARDVWMERQHLCRLQAEGHVLGLHTHTHPTRLTELPAAEQLREYRDNYMSLLALLGEPPTTVAHPCNACTEETLAILRGLGVRLGFRSHLAPGQHSELEFPREDCANLLRQMRCGGAPHQAVVEPAAS